MENITIDLENAVSLVWETNKQTNNTLMDWKFLNKKISHIMKRKLTACFPRFKESKKICLMYNKYAKALDQPTREGSRIYIKSFLKKKVKQAPVWMFRVLLTLSEKKLLF